VPLDYTTGSRDAVITEAVERAAGGPQLTTNPNDTAIALVEQGLLEANPEPIERLFAIWQELSLPVSPVMGVSLALKRRMGGKWHVTPFRLVPIDCAIFSRALAEKLAYLLASSPLEATTPEDGYKSDFEVCRRLGGIAPVQLDGWTPSPAPSDQDRREAQSFPIVMGFEPPNAGEPQD
jgi:hypothetical protein